MNGGDAADRQNLRGEAAPTFFVGVRPPAFLAGRVLAWQGRLKHVVTAPHVTLKAPGRWSAAQLRAGEQACRRARPFEVWLGGVQTFGDRVVFLQAAGAGLNALHAELVAALVSAVDEPAGEFELAGYHPHLTLALSWRSMRLPWTEALTSAQEEFAALADAPLGFEVRQATLFRKTLPGQPYVAVEHWPLEG